MFDNVLRKQNGYTLMEVMVAASMLVVLIGMLRLVQIQTISLNYSKVRTTGMNLANRLMEERETDPNLIVVGNQTVNLVAQQNNTYRFSVQSNYVNPDGSPSGTQTNLVRVRISLTSPRYTPAGSSPSINPTLLENIITIQ